jgi:hypothetical protein
LYLIHVENTVRNVNSTEKRTRLKIIGMLVSAFFSEILVLLDFSTLQDKHNILKFPVKIFFSLALAAKQARKRLKCVIFQGRQTSKP